MMKFFIIIILTTFFMNHVNAEKNYDECYWDNKKNPCVKIKNYVSNISEYSKGGVRKYTINKKQIEDSAAIDIIDVLKTIPGIQITQSGPKGQQASLFMRGTGSNHTLVLLNGIPINDQSTTQGLHDFGVDFIQAIQQIEVYPGPSAIHFGSNALGGAINLITAGDYKDSINFKAMNLKNVDFLVNKNFLIDDRNEINFKLGGVFEDNNSAKFGGVENDELKNLSGNLNLKKWLDEKTKITSTTYLRQTIAEYDSSSTNEIGYEGNNKMLATQLGLTRVEKNSENNLILYYNGYDREYDEDKVIDNYYSEAFGGKVERSAILSEKISYGLGSEYRYDWGNFENRGSYSASTKGHLDNISIFSNFGINFLNNKNLSFFIRSDDNKMTGQHSTYKFDFSKKFKKNKIGISRMTGLRNPTLYELFGTDNYGYSGNISLNPEKSSVNEIYSEMYFFDRLYFSFKGYRSQIYDHIEYSSNQYKNNSNQTNLNQTGFENMFILGNNNEKLSLFTSFTSSDKTDSSPQLRRPDKTYGINYLKKFKNTSLGNFDLLLNYKHYGKHFDTHSSNFSTIEMDSTDLIDLSFNKKIKDSVYFLKISNLTDEGYQRPHGYIQNGRKLRMGVKRSF